MRVLGITTEYESGAAAVEDGRVIAAINEERLLRVKLAAGFPRRSIAATLETAGWTVDDLDSVLVAGTEDLYSGEAGPYHGWFEFKPEGFGRWLKRSVGSRLARFRDALPVLEKGYYLILGPSFRRRRKIIREILREDFGVGCPIEFVDHHFCHATSAYYTSDFEDALVASLDGGGDGKSSRVYAVRAGEFEELADTTAFDSLGNYYAYVTHLCGFKAHRHEGKITGLSARGRPEHLELLEEFITEDAGRFKNTGRVVFDHAVQTLERRLPDGWRREDLAASVQVLFERLTRRWLDHWLEESGLRDVALAGGVFANVRVNQVLHESPRVDRLFVHPGMGDGGLAVGAALAASVPGVLGPDTKPMEPSGEPIRDVYLGPGLAANEIEGVLESHGLDFDRPSSDHELAGRIAELLADGYVVARATGRMEYGPRALGHRSILYQPADPEVNDWLNENLYRTEFMPFAPSILWEERERCFENLEGAELTARFMTITFECTEWMRRHMPGVVHVDGTARPQLVHPDSSPGFHAILRAFHERTGLPGVVNTSFNMHEEPIVCTAADCVRAFLAAKIDYLALGDCLVPHPEPAARTLRPVEASGTEVPSC